MNWELINEIWIWDGCSSISWGRVSIDTLYISSEWMNVCIVMGPHLLFEAECLVAIFIYPLSYQMNVFLKGTDTHPWVEEGYPVALSCPLMF